MIDIMMAHIQRWRPGVYLYRYHSDQPALMFGDVTVISSLPFALTYFSLLRFDVLLDWTQESTPPSEVSDIQSFAVPRNNTY